MRRLLGFLLGLLPVSVAVIVLWPGLWAWFIADDQIHLGYMRYVSQPWGVWVGPITGQGIFRPVTFTVNFLQEQVTGLNSRPLHLVDLGLHSLNIILVFLFGYYLFRRKPGGGWFKRKPAAEEELIRLVSEQNAPKPGEDFSPWWAGFCAALLFAAHPVSGLTASWFACRADFLATFFSLLTLFLLVWRRGLSFSFGFFIFLTSLFAMLSKETHYPLFLAAFFLGFFLAEGAWSRRLKQGCLFAGPSFLALIVVLVWRGLVIGGGGLYGPALPSSLSDFFYQALYHSPRVLVATARDFVFHHLRREDYLLWPLLASGSLVLVLGAPAGMIRRRRELGFGLALCLASLTPLWNVSHMFLLREERLLYFPLVGFCLVVAGLVSAPRILSVKLMVGSALLFLILTFGFYSRARVEEWRETSERHRRKCEAIAEYLRQPASFQVFRVYVLGLEHDDYYLDGMVKMFLSTPLLSREILPGDRPGFVWVPRSFQSGFSSQNSLGGPYPRREDHATAPEMVFQTVHPPDLLAAASQDGQARVLLWNGFALRDLTPRLRNLYQLRLALEARARNFPSTLPSFSFRKSRVKFDWEPAVGLEVIEPLIATVPYTLVAHDHDPYLLSPDLKFPALSAQWFELEMTLPPRPYLPPGEDQGCLMWQSQRQPFFSPERTICFPVVADGQSHLYRLDLASNIHWAQSGIITKLRLDPISYPATFQLESLEFYTP